MINTVTRRFIPALGIATALLTVGMSTSRASTIWNGPTISFTHTDENGLSDQITSGVAFDRSSDGLGLYNSVTESGATAGISPADTEWAVGTLDQYDSPSYSPCPLEQGNYPPGYIGTTFVVHLISEDIYFELTLTDWEGSGGSPGKTFSYTRTTAGVVAPPTPTVTVTNPASGAVYAAPASIKLGANASVSSGTVTNVQFFAGATSLGSVTAAPFNLTSPPVAAGSYSITAVATAAGVSATSSVVNVSIVTPVNTTISNLARHTNTISFNYSANAGLSYVVQSSSNLFTWVSLSTNVAGSSSISFTNTLKSSGALFFRVGRQPNP